MAIESHEKFQDQNIKSSCSKSTDFNNCGPTRTEYYTNNIYNKRIQNKLPKNGSISPYLSEDRIQLLSRVTEKRFLQNNSNFNSSFPLAVNIYKANSDQLRLSKRRNKKVKKSVLTLPNDPAPLPQACTVSDMNDSEYCKENKDIRKSKPKKKKLTQKKRNCRVADRQTALYKRDANYCSQLDIDVDGSSTDIIVKCDSRYNMMGTQKNVCVKNNLNANNVWAVLQNVNQFKFKHSPPMSQDSVLTIKKKKKINTKTRNRKDTSLIETCRTEEFAYISSVVDNNSSRNSYSESSFDRITVIEKQENFCTIFDEIEKGVTFAKPYDEPSNINNQSLMRPRKTKMNKNCRNTLYRNKTKENVPPLKNTIGYRRQLNFSDGDKSYLNNGIKNYRICKNNKITSNEYDNNVGVVYNVFSNYSPSENSDSSKGGVRRNRNTESNINLKDEVLANKTHQVTGITKVVLNQTPLNTVTNGVESIKRKPTLQTIKPPKLMMPNLTLTDIKRKITNLRFPIVILGKEQLSSAFTIEDYEPPQFEGLDKHIWPFMKKWCEDIKMDSSENEIIKKYKPKDSLNNVSYMHHFMDQTENTKRYNTNLVSKNKYSTYSKQSEGNQIKSLDVVRPMQRLKERIVQLMHKKSESKQETSIKKNVFNKQENKSKLIDASTNTQCLSDVVEQKTVPAQSLKNIIPHSNNHIKSKSKWGSEFIENIFRKIRSGVYYYQDDKHDLAKRSTRTKEDCVQTEIQQLNNNCLIVTGTDNNEKCTINNEDNSLISIPGFDNSLSDLEIETLGNCNQIAVKHCITNIVIQFDVAVKFDNNSVQIKKSFSCIPIAATENQPAIYKCRTTIINAILPAELCSILPKLVKKIIDPNMISARASSNVCGSNLSTISEISPNENDHKRCLIPVQINYKVRANILQGGNFPQIDFKNKTNDPEQKNLIHKTDQLLLPKLLKVFIPPDLIRSIDSTYRLLRNSKNIPNQMNNADKMRQFPNETCKVLQLYPFSAKQVILASTNFSFTRIVANIFKNMYLKIFIKAFFSHNNNQTIFCNKPSIITLSIDTLYYGMNNNVLLNNTTNECSTKSMAIEKVPTLGVYKRKSRNDFCVRNKRKVFVKLYRKCKSMSNISGSRSATSLDKINDLHDFFLALGTGKALAGVLNGSSEMKILSSIKEMKTWINDITPRQALLVLLLANKKDTTNIIRYRPIILQGIAVNRITQTTELDMEIEVIERENLNKIPQYEGITYIPASDENQDSLLEELCWIAKTTASDYQKSFDESSERLLKSLLEKRKKLNPSYLRVMARYVGLGLLKKSKK